MASGPSLDLSTFTDIMSCLLGVLVLIILVLNALAFAVRAWAVRRTSPPWLP